MPQISIITPVLNGAGTLLRCYNSLRRQSMADFEWIVVDDASTDVTPQVLDEIKLKGERRIRLHRCRHHEGALRARQLGIAMCSAPYVTFLDADDRLLPGALQAYADAIRTSESDIYIIGSKLRFTPFPVRVNYSVATSGPKPEMLTGSEACLRMLAGDGITANLWDKLYRADLLEKYATTPLPPLSVGEDYVLNMPLLAHARSVALLPAVGYEWSYNGLGEKYFLRNWSAYLNSVDCALNIGQTLPLPRDAMLQAIGDNYLKCLTEACVRRILHQVPAKEIERIADEGLKHPAALVCSNPPGDTAEFLNTAKLHLRNHRFFYTFTHILNRIM